MITKTTESTLVPVNEPLLSGNEKKYLLECIESNWISSEGPFVKRFEREFAARVGRRFGVAVSSGTTALQVAVSTLGIGAGDEVIMPTFTIISCAGVVVRAGAKPILVDSDVVTWNMDVSQIESKITPRTKAIMVVHTYGLPIDMEPVLELAGKYNLKIIEDAAEAHGLNYRNKPCGSFGDISIFSFYPNKLVTTGEGGMIVTDDEHVAGQCRSLRNLCFQSKRRFIHDELGWNFRMTNLQAAVGVAQLEQLDKFIEKKQWIGSRYTELLADIGKLELPAEQTEYAENIYWVYGVVMKDEIDFDAKEARRRLDGRKIGTRSFFWSMHEQPVFKKMGLFENESYPVAEKLARRGFYIPSGLALTELQIKYVVESLKGILK
ncbi:MAG: DegT/DnrJ/EryC1/StrS family aminotransferase [Planctomycetota bacterium]|jgi:perosamine synthetase